MTPGDAGELLTPAELFELTGKKRFKAQRAALLKMGVRHMLRPNGSPVVARALVSALLAVSPTPSVSTPQFSGVLDLSPLPRKRGSTTTS
jgi:hypothetical protein